jgi:DnaK suppressor protein
MDVETARTALLAEQERIERDLAHVRGEMIDPGRDSAERLGAGPDDPVEAYTSDLEEGMEDDLQASLDEVEEALKRIDAGTYGVCVDCGEPIPDKRLEALPASARCMDCQRKAEHR